VKRVKVTGDLWHGKVPDGAAYVGRQAPGLRRSRWHNPHKVSPKPCPECAGALHEPAEAVRLHRLDLLVHPELWPEIRSELALRDLACWCRLDEACHADVLLAVANGEDP
jgi:hypothetical protein